MSGWCLKVPDGYQFSRTPISVEEVVVPGFGRGSKQLGVPTANLRPDDLFSGPLDGLPLGVYFGYIQSAFPSLRFHHKLCLSGVGRSKKAQPCHISGSKKIVILIPQHEASFLLKKAGRIPKNQIQVGTAPRA